jgi:large subunit ribosomal protein L25
MEVGKLTAEVRVTGKANLSQVRRAGKIPAVVYGGGADPIAIAIDPSLLLKALDPVKKTNTVIELSVGSEKLTVMVREHQKDALRGDLTHADFIRVQLDKDVHAVVPVMLTGKSEGVKEGGIMHQVIHKLEIACTPDKIPVKLEIDVTNLKMNEALHVRDLKLPPGIKALAAAGQTVCACTAPKAEKVEEVAAPVEGAVAAPGAPGAPAAAGAPGAPAAGGAAPAAGDKKGAPAKEDKKK